jgi:hypothetical protein
MKQKIRSKSSVCIVLLSLTLLVVITFAVEKRIQLVRAQRHTSLAGVAPQQIGARTGEAANVAKGVIQLLLRPEGFDSQTLTIDRGRYILILLNRTGLENLALRVSRVVGNSEKPKELMFEGKKKYRIDNLIDLTPGDYVITVLEHPDWVCRITAMDQ